MGSQVRMVHEIRCRLSKCHLGLTPFSMTSFSTYSVCQVKPVVFDIWWFKIILIGRFLCGVLRLGFWSMVRV